MSFKEKKASGSARERSGWRREYGERASRGEQDARGFHE
jgi:hypothetical protein